MPELYDKVGREIRGSTSELLLKLLGLGAGEVNGMPSGAVECVDMRRNTSGESDSLDCN